MFVTRKLQSIFLLSFLLEIPSFNVFQSKLFQAFPHPPATVHSSVVCGGSTWRSTSLDLPSLRDVQKGGCSSFIHQFPSPTGNLTTILSSHRFTHPHLHVQSSSDALPPSSHVLLFSNLRDQKFVPHKCRRRLNFTQPTLVSILLELFCVDLRSRGLAHWAPRCRNG